MGSEARACAALIAASLLVTTAAHADPTAADRETARSLMQQGRELRDKGNLAEALKRFKGADDIMHVPTTALEVARVQVSLGQLVEARDAIAAIRLMPEKASDPAPFKDARVKAEQLDASLNGRVPALTIVVQGAAQNESATITVDGVPVPEKAASLPRSVDPGHHVVVAKTPSAEGKLEVDVAEGEQKKVEVALVSTAPAPAQDAPETPPAAPNEETPEPTATRSHAPTPLTWIGVGLGGAGLVAGTATGLMTLSKKSSLDSACADKVCGPSSYSDLDSANTLATVSTIAFAAAGAGAALAIVSLVVGHEQSAPASPPSASVRWTPWVGAGAAGVSGTF
jgi:hypothetical protein